MPFGTRHRFPTLRRLVSETPCRRQENISLSHPSKRTPTRSTHLLSRLDFCFSRATLPNYLEAPSLEGHTVRHRSTFCDRCLVKNLPSANSSDESRIELQGAFCSHKLSALLEELFSPQRTVLRERS